MITQIHMDRKVLLHRIFYTACIIFGLLSMLLAAYISGFYTSYPDIPHYEKMAQGEFEQIRQPFASRILAPVIANSLMGWSDFSAATALAIVNVISLFLFFGLAGYYLMHNGVKLADALIFLMMPYPFVMTKYLYVPDAIGVLLCFALLIFSFWSKTRMPMFLFGVLAITARKTFFAPVIALSLFFAYRRNYISAAVLLGSIIVGFAIIEWVVGDQTANRHNMNMLSYYLLKVPANLLTNVGGINLYTNTYQWCKDPVLIFDVSFVPMIGDIQEVGFCYPSFLIIVRTFFIFITIFGLWPYIAFVCLYDKTSWNNVNETFVVVTALLFFFLSPGFGRTVERLFIYSYPFFVFAGPYLIQFVRKSNKWKLLMYTTIILQFLGMLFFVLPRS